jgi:hypothetical protein
LDGDAQIRTRHCATTIGRVFPLFSPEGERSWVPGWSPEILSGDGERGSVFRTCSGDGRTTTWICCRFDVLTSQASYARLTEGSNIGLVDVECVAIAPALTRVKVTYTLTSLGEEGDEFVREFLEKASYTTFIEEWKLLLDNFFSQNMLDNCEPSSATARWERKVAESAMPRAGSQN